MLHSPATQRDTINVMSGTRNTSVPIIAGSGNNFPPRQKSLRTKVKKLAENVASGCLMCIGIILCCPFICVFFLLDAIGAKIKARRIAEYDEWVRRTIEEGGSPLIFKKARYAGRGPEWYEARKRPITPPPPDSSSDVSESKPDCRTIQQTSFFFTKIPLELRRRIYDFALGEEMLRAEVEGSKLKAWRCSNMTRNFWTGDDWTKELHYNWKYLNHPAADEEEEDWKWQRHQGNVNLLRTCRQVYLEAISSLYSTQTFVLAIGDHNDEADKPTLLYLPYFILPQRLDQIRSLYIHWSLDPEPFLHIGISQKTLSRWTECWNMLSRFPNLQELLIRFECAESRIWDWQPLERQLKERTSRIKVARKFVVVLPFQQTELELGVGDSGCEFRVPEERREIAIE